MDNNGQDDDYWPLSDDSDHDEVDRAPAASVNVVNEDSASDYPLSESDAENEFALTSSDEEANTAEAPTSASAPVNISNAPSSSSVIDQPGEGPGPGQQFTLAVNNEDSESDYPLSESDDEKEFALSESDNEKEFALSESDAEKEFALTSSDEEANTAEAPTSASAAVNISNAPSSSSVIDQPEGGPGPGQRFTLNSRRRRPGRTSPGPTRQGPLPPTREDRQIGPGAQACSSVYKDLCVDIAFVNTDDEWDEN